MVESTTTTLCHWIDLCQSLVKSLYILRQPILLIKTSETDLFYLCVSMKLLSATFSPHWSSRPLGGISRLMWNSLREFPIGSNSPSYTLLAIQTYCPSGAWESCTPALERRTHAQSRSCVLWMVNVGGGPQSKGEWSSCRNRTQSLHVNLMLKANSSLLTWLKPSAKGSWGNVSVLGIQTSAFMIKFYNFHGLTSNSPHGSTLDHSLLCLVQDPWIRGNF